MTITPLDYQRDPNKRAIADEVIRRGGLVRDDVTLIETTPRGWRCLVLNRDWTGRPFKSWCGDYVSEHWFWVN